MRTPRRHPLRSWTAAAVLAASLLAVGPRPAVAVESAKQAEENKPAYLKGIGIDQKLGEKVPLDLTFRDENGNPVKLGQYFDGKRKPVILVLVYYSCPQLCTLVLNDLSRGLNGLSTLSVGDDFEVVTVSIDPSDTTELARDRKATYLASYRRPHAAQGWHFLTGDQTSIRRLTDAVGFHYRWDPKFQQFMHPSGLTILTPNGTISRYFFGIDYDLKDLRLSLEEASNSKIGSVTDRILLYCFHYDESSGKYTPIVSSLGQGRRRADGRLPGHVLVRDVPLRAVPLRPGRRRGGGRGRRLRRRRRRGDAADVGPVAGPAELTAAGPPQRDSNGRGETMMTPGGLIASGTLATIGKFQLFPDQASTLAPQVDYLYFYLVGVTVFFSVLIAALIIYFSVKYRRQHDDERPAEIHPSKLLEASWVIIPFILVMVMFAWGAVIFVNYTRPPANAMEINVIGKQWMWKVQHPDGQREINELHVPVNQPVRLTMTSQDVIHDFGLPAFRIKMDVLPGRYTSEWFEATVPGEYHLFCDQYCGTQHSRMVGKVVVMEADKYQAWLSGARQNVTTVEAGQALFKEYSCVNCHSQEAPTMANVYGSVVKVWQDGKLIDQKADDWYIRDSIVNPNHQIVEGYQPLMPSYKGRLSEEQILQLVAYIKTLGVGHQGGRVDKLKMLEATPPPMVETPHPGDLTK